MMCHTPSPRWVSSRACKSSVLLLNALLLSAGLTALTTADGLAQHLVQPPAPQSPHWTHINIFDFGRAFEADGPSATAYDAYEWFTSHVDAAEVQGNAAVLRKLNPTMKLAVYQFDLSTFANADSAALPEEYFLHFSEDTRLRFLSLDRSREVGTATVRGCPAPTPVTRDCRIQSYLWEHKRYLFNINNPAFRSWKADRLLGPVNDWGNVWGPGTVDSDEIWLDEHGPGFLFPHSWGWQTNLVSGGGIREFNGRRPGTEGDSFDQNYNHAVVDWLTYLNSTFKSAGKRALINAWKNVVDPMAVAQARAINGMNTEHKHLPDAWDGPSEYQEFINVAKRIVGNGGLIQLEGMFCYTGPAGYTAGNYGSSYARYRMWRLASYYLLKEPVGSSGLVYFDAQFCSNETKEPLNDRNDWLPAYQVDVGQPTGEATVYQKGTAGCSYQIFSRTYTHALILVRPQDGTSCTAYADSSAAIVSFAKPVQILREDGTLAAPAASVKIRNAEALIAFPTKSFP